jgi:hypothetical protein
MASNSANNSSKASLWSTRKSDSLCAQIVSSPLSHIMPGSHGNNRSISRAELIPSL